jgi:hypothetical protein
MADERKVIFVLRVFAAKHETMAQELAHIQRACDGASHDARAAGGAQREGLVKADGGVDIAGWEYSPGELVAS